MIINLLLMYLTKSKNNQKILWNYFLRGRMFNRDTAGYPCCKTVGLKETVQSLMKTALSKMRSCWEQNILFRRLFAADFCRVTPPSPFLPAQFLSPLSSADTKRLSTFVKCMLRITQTTCASFLPAPLVSIVCSIFASFLVLFFHKMKYK